MGKNYDTEKVPAMDEVCVVSTELNILGSSAVA